MVNSPRGERESNIMPHTTFGYQFEAKVSAFASEIAERFAANHATFILTLNMQDSVSSLSFDKPSSGWSEVTDMLDAQNIPYLFSDPFDAPGGLSWSGIAR